MNRQLMTQLRPVQRIACLVVIAVLVIAGLSGVYLGNASAATQVASRSIQLSDSGPSGGTLTSGVGSGTNVTYRVTFTPGTQAGSMVIDFCSNDPILADSCTAPTGLDLSSATLTNVSGTIGGTGWTLTKTSSQVKLADTTSPGSQDMQASTQQVFDLSGVTNPTTTGTFYARMYAYAGNAYGGGSGYTNVTTLGNYVDYGGVAMSTAAVINITARVQESLSFCVTGSPPASWTTHDCSDTTVSATAPSLILGHGTPTAVLDANHVDYGLVYSQLSTNATHGAVIDMRNSNLTCGGLSADSGTTCAIPAANGGSATAGTILAGTAGFGVMVQTMAPISGDGAVGTITPSPSYYDSGFTDPTTVGGAKYGMDTTSTSAQVSGQSAYSGAVTSTFGSMVASATAPVYRVNNSYTFAATAGLTTPAGIYTANLALVATGTF